MTENEISYKVIALLWRCIRILDQACLNLHMKMQAHDLIDYGLNIRKQVPMPFIYKALKMDVGYRIDLIVEDRLIIEVKACESLAPVHFAQVLTYLKLSDLKLGLLINFNTNMLKEGIHRIVNNL